MGRPSIDTGSRGVPPGLCERASPRLRLDRGAGCGQGHAANSPTGPLAWSLDINPQAVTSGRVVGTLAARARIRELEEGGQWTRSRGSRQRDRRDERVVGAIVQLATRYGLASRETSWVIVEKREVATSEPAVLRRVPIAIASGWGGSNDRALLDAADDLLGACRPRVLSCPMLSKDCYRREARPSAARRSEANACLIA
jgi:Ca-activated chloride channel homolog